MDLNFLSSCSSGSWQNSKGGSPIPTLLSPSIYLLLVIQSNTKLGTVAKDFADVTEVSNQLTLRSGDYHGARADLIRWTLKRTWALPGEKDSKSETDSTLAGLKMEGTVWQRMWVAFRSWEQPPKKWGPQVYTTRNWILYNHMTLENDLELPRRTKPCGHLLTMWNPEQRTQSCRAQPSDL